MPDPIVQREARRMCGLRLQEAKQIYTEMVVSTHGGTPIISWMVYFMENPTKMYDLGVPLFQETTKCTLLFARLQPI
jgi:hypothetical protein